MKCIAMRSYKNMIAVLIVFALLLQITPLQEVFAASNTYSGTWSMKAVVSGTPTWKGTTVDLNVAANTNYVVKFWLSGTGKITAKVANSNWSGNLAETQATATNTWTQVTMNFNSGSNTSIHFQFQDTGNTAGTIYLDEVFLGVNGGSNLIGNGGFEQGASGWYIPSDATGIFSIVQSTTTTPTNPVTEKYVHSGALSLKATVSGTPTWKGTTVDLNVAQNTNYTVRFWIYGTGKLSLKVANSNWSGNLSDVQYTASNTWTQVTFNFNSGTNSSIHLQFYDSGNTVGKVYIDDVFLGIGSGTNLLGNGGFELGVNGWYIPSDATGIFSISHNPTIIGVYEGISLTAPVNYGNWLGRHDFYLYSTNGYANWSDFQTSTNWLIDEYWSKMPYKTIWNVGLITTQEGTLAEAATGAYNNYYRTVAQNIANYMADEDVIYVRPAWEFNGDWFPWTVVAKNGENQQTKTQNFINAWHQYVDTFRSVSSKFRFEWNVNIGQERVYSAELAYPGDAYVDVIGMDFYDENTWAHINDPAKRFQYSVIRPYGLNWIRDFARTHNKQLSFSEWGLGGLESGDNSYLVEAMQRWFLATDVLYQTYWDSGDADYDAKLSTPSNHPNASAMYKQIFGSYTANPTINTPGNVIAAITSPVGIVEGDYNPALSTSPTQIKGIALDPDGNNFITGVTVTIQNASGQYLNVATKTFGSTAVYNPASYNINDGYWTLNLTGITLGSGTYTVRGYANDGANSTPAMCGFTR